MGRRYLIFWPSHWLIIIVLGSAFIGQLFEGGSVPVFGGTIDRLAMPAWIGLLDFVGIFLIFFATFSCVRGFLEWRGERSELVKSIEIDKEEELKVVGEDESLWDGFSVFITSACKIGQVLIVDVGPIVSGIAIIYFQWNYIPIFFAHIKAMNNW